MDPTIGRFRNLVQTAVISTKSSKRPSSQQSASATTPKRRIIESERDSGDSAGFNSSVLGDFSISSAPNLDTYSMKPTSVTKNNMLANNSDSSKKKYAKEAWPGRKPVLS